MEGDFVNVVFLEGTVFTVLVILVGVSTDVMSGSLVREVGGKRRGTFRILCGDCFICLYTYTGSCVFGPIRTRSVIGRAFTGV